MDKRDVLEQFVLACMLIDSNCSLDYELLNIEDFTEQANKDIYVAIKNLVKNNKNIDLVTIHNALNKKVNMSYLANLFSAMPTTSNFKQYVEQLKDLTLKRKLHKLADDIRDTEKTGKELTEYAEKQIFELREETSISEFTKVNDIIMDAYFNIEDIYFEKKERGLSTGYSPIDNLVGGLRKKEYILLAARPSIGKTALAINITQNLIMNNKTVAFFSYEMGKEQLVDRLLKGRSMIDIKKLNHKKMNDNDWQLLQGSANSLLNRNLYIDDDPNKTVGDMLSMCRKLKRTVGLDLVIIDYLQKIRSTIKGNKREMLEYVSNDVKNMAKALDCPVLAISSLSRANEQREIKIPQLSDLRETGQLEFDADVVMFLHRDYYHKPYEEGKKYDADLVVAKNRNGATGRAKLMWFANNTMFTTVERGARMLETINTN